MRARQRAGAAGNRRQFGEYRAPKPRACIEPARNRALQSAERWRLVAGLHVSGPGRAMWFTEFYGNFIGRITMDGTITNFAIPGGDAEGITKGGDGNLWFTEPGYQWIVRMTPSGTSKVFQLPLSQNESPRGVTLGPDGNVWWAELYDSYIGRITPQGTITRFAIRSQQFEPSIKVPTQNATPWASYMPPTSTSGLPSEMATRSASFPAEAFASFRSRKPIATPRRSHPLPTGSSGSPRVTPRAVTISIRKRTSSERGSRCRAEAFPTVSRPVPIRNSGSASTRIPRPIRSANS